MTLRTYPNRFLVAIALSSLLLLGLCGTVAVYLNEEQARTADELGEDIGSRRAAAELEETLTNLVALHRRGVGGVESLHGRVEDHLAEINRFANKEQERVQASRIEESYQTYLRLWAARRHLSDQQAALAEFLQDDTLPACQRLRDYNATQIEESGQAHRRSLQRMTWGLAVVGGLGSVAGLVLGYGLARGLRRTIHQFLVRVQGAVDRLGQELPAIEWQRRGDLQDDGADDLVNRVEQAVLKLQQQDREVRAAERLAAVGQLAAGIAHEIRNPLTSAILLIQTGRRDPSAGGLTDEDLDLVERELQRIETTLQTFLGYTRPPKLERLPCDLAAVVKDALGLVRGRAAQQGVEVLFEAPEKREPLHADPEQLRQVAVNLILNALDVMPHGGALVVRLSLPADGPIKLTVTDTGPGISADIFPRLFQPFATSKETGLGLGLVVSQRIVEGHGGTIRGQNRPEGGACFVVQLPRAGCS